MSEVASLYKTSAAMSEEPDEGWIARGVRGVQTHLRRALKALEREDIPAKAEAMDKAAQLMFLLIDITPTGDENPLGDSLSKAYQELHSAIVQANVENDADIIRMVITECAKLSGDIGAMQRRASAA